MITAILANLAAGILPSLAGVALTSIAKAKTGAKGPAAVGLQVASVGVGVAAEALGAWIAGMPMTGATAATGAALGMAGANLGYQLAKQQGSTWIR